ncbi:hypothetical protein [Azovibrio restrictus]|uniref:hypothetical protein n=1 Tax=Azovibrio restrictus TaxID=146938 RepID=UPI00047D6170|nr:hypothetical protein [Azovibrio restrictus]
MAWGGPASLAGRQLQVGGPLPHASTATGKLPAARAAPDAAPFSALRQAFSSYLDDYCRIFNQHAEANGFEYPSTYHVEDSWKNYERVRPVLEQRFAEWQEWRQLEANRRLEP